MHIVQAGFSYGVVCMLLLEAIMRREQIFCNYLQVHPIVTHPTFMCQKNIK
jgi:hypothetical protein